jgi:hypothetical protein
MINTTYASTLVDLSASPFPLRNIAPSKLVITRVSFLASVLTPTRTTPSNNTKH